MRLSVVMDALGAALDQLDGLKGFPYPSPAVTPPAALVGWPYDIDDTGTMARGMWQATFPVLIVVGKSDLKSARDAMSEYLDSSSPASVHAALTRGRGRGYDAAVVGPDGRVEPISIAGVEYLGAVLDVRVTGQGAS